MLQSLFPGTTWRRNPASQKAVAAAARPATTTAPSASPRVPRTYVPPRTSSPAVATSASAESAAAACTAREP